MKILDFLKRHKKVQFVSEIDFITNLGRQSHLAVEMLVALREFDIEEDHEFEIEYFFHSNSIEKAKQLQKELSAINSLKGNEVIESKRPIVIKGQTAPVKMMHETLKKWATQMCELGYKHDCRFENWQIKR